MLWRVLVGACVCGKNKLLLLFGGKDDFGFPTVKLDVLTGLSVKVGFDWQSS